MESGQSRDLNAVIDAFERCQSQSGPVDFAEFLPARDHPRFEAIALELVRVDIEYSWNRRLPRSLDDYRRQIPELFVDPRDRALIAFEEYRQRRRAGERATREEYARRLEIDVSDWDEVACPAHDEESQIAGISSSSTPDDSPPLRPGASFAGFELVRELGRGSSSRVFLARQPSLALRHVVLKISRERTVEPDRLARLQHTNIMPIHSFHQVGEWHAICMPYFGSFVLSDWVEHLRERRTPPVTSEELETLHAILRDATWTQPDQGDSSSSPPAVPLATTTITAPLRPEGLTRRNEGRQSYEQTVVALAARLARALGHAHDHGVLHLDLKPANILLTPDGEPMLLDFHLSTADGAPEGGRLYVGGTLPYMSPEQLQSLTSGTTVDARSDVYALGVVLFELLTGQLPFPARKAALADAVRAMLDDRRRPPGVRDRRPETCPATAAIIARCLAPEPAQRYQSAHELAEDLDRQLHDLPLRYAGNPSVTERLRKFSRRHPRLTSVGMMLTLALGALAIGAGLWRVRERRLAAFEARSVFADFKHGAAEAKVALLLPDLTSDERDHELQRVRRLLAMYGAGDSDDWRRGTQYRALDMANRSQLDRDVGHLLYLWIHALRRGEASAETAENSGDRRVPVALALNSRAQACFPKDEVPQALRIQRRELLHNAGLDWSEPSDDDSGDDGPPRAALDRAFQALDCVARGDYRGGVELLRELRYSVPQDFTVQFLAGVCHESLHQFQQAETCFSACLSLRPDSARALYERGLCRFALRQFPEARRDFEEVLSLEPENRSALVSRALTLAAVGNHADAVTDLTKAIDRGFPETRVYFLRAGLLRKLGNDSGAERDRHEGLTRTPSDPRSWVSRGIANLPLNPHQALADFREAVRLNPREYEAHRNIAHVLAERLNQPAEALGVLDHLLEMTADDPLAWAGRGVLLARQGQVDGARRDAERALAVRRDAVVLYQAACIHALCGDWGELSSTDERLRLVLPLLSEALQIDPALADVALTDSDLKSVQSARPFQQVVAAAQLLRLARDPGEIPSIGSGREGAAE